ncbi:MAG: hypothetical protein PHF25_03835 [Candidatus Margulisbacteria bacterium]|nr:hypothetical protein [Candidatus Margulisiibacteriota bacterium]
MFDLFITSNGPGEITTWVHPFVKRIKKEIEDVRITLFIVPCRFKAGNEYEVAKQIKEIDNVYSAKEFKYRLIRLPFEPYKKGCVVFMGGDLGKAVLLKKRYRFPAIAYTEGDKSFKLFFNKIFTRDKDGDLMYSFFEDYNEDKQLIETLKETKNVVFFSGSRPKQFKALFPIFQEVSKLLPKGYKCIYSISPYISDNIIQKAKCDSRKLITYKNKSAELMKTAELCVSIPGTNNIQLAYLNAPSLIVFPFNKPKVIDFPGLIGLIANVPGGRYFKKRLILKYLGKNVEFTSLVNRKENMEIFPELRGDLTAKQIALSITKLLSNKQELNKIKEKCLALSKTSNVLDNMVLKVKSFNEK